MTLIPIAVYWTIALWGLASSRPVLLYLMLGSLCFSAFAVIPTGMTGGLTFVPATMTLFLIIVKTFCNKQRLLVGIAAALDPSRLAILTAFWVSAVIATLFMPRLFAGSVTIVSLRGDVSAGSPLYPSTQNISQLAYLTISILGVIALSQIFRGQAMRQLALHAVVVSSILTVVTGLADYASQFVPVAPFLDIFRTASYALLVDAEMASGKRVVGLTPEASVYGSICISQLCLIYFLRRGMHNAFLRDVVSPILVVTLIGMVWLSTSSAAYVGLAVFLLLAATEWLLRMFDTRYNPLRKRHLGLEFGAAASGLGLVALVLLLSPSVVDAVMEKINEIVLTKTESSSYVERSMWTAISLQSLFDTYGLGVGLGSTRASNILVAVISSVGVVGGLAYFWFIGQCFLVRADPRDQADVVILSALRYAVIPPLVVSILVGTTADFGSIGAFRYALMMAIGFAGSASANRLRSFRHRDAGVLHARP